MNLIPRKQMVMPRKPVLVAFSALALVAVSPGAVSSQQAECSNAQLTDQVGNSAKDAVYQLWGMAASGRLLNRKGWTFASKYFFSKQSPWPTDGSVQVVSDFWSVGYDRCSGDQVIVPVTSTWGPKPGIIDSQLRFTEPVPSSAYETAIGYRLVLTTLHIYKPGGHEPKRWLFQGEPPPPFATVTAAIRYVLEKRNESKDPVIRRNADQTLAELLSLH